MKALLILLLGAASILFGLLVLSRDTKRVPNITFFCLSIFVGGWNVGIGAFFLASDPVSALWWAKFYYSMPLLLVYSLTLLTDSFPTGRRVHLDKAIAFALPVLVVLVPLVSQRHFLTAGIAYHDWGKEIVLNHSQYLAYSIVIVSYFVLSMIMVLEKMRKEVGLYRKQALLLLVGLITSASLGVYYNLILPWVGNYRIIWAGPLATSFFMGAIAISVVRHKMFDVRAVVARALGYSVALFAFAMLYGFVVFGSLSVIAGQSFTRGTLVVSSLLAAITSIAFPYMKAYFDRQTNRLFYRDAYDAQEVLAEINQTAITNLDVRLLLSKSSDIVDKYLKVSTCTFLVAGSGANADYLQIGDGRASYSSKSIDYIKELHKTQKQEIIVADEMAHDHADAYHNLSNMNVGIVARLSTDKADGQDDPGVWLLIGRKKSGNPFGRYDIEVIRVICGELIIAVQNAKRFEEIERFNETLERKVRDATRKLQKTNEKLVQLDETKDEFISMASHQLRTPLTSIKGYLSMVLEGDAGSVSPMQRKMLDQAFVSSQRMVALIADLLNVSRLRTGKFVIEQSMTNLADVVQSEVAQLKETAIGRQLELTCEVPHALTPLYMDETKTRQVIMNFIDNAIYYTPAGGHITVRLAESAKMIEFSVTDDGIGVPKAEQFHLFTKFYRAGNARKARPDGTGLGLFMAKKVIVAQGGAVLFKSRPGKGSTFGFTFAKNKLQLPQKP